MRFTIFLIAMTLSASANAGEPTQGYYQGLSILYPYKPVYCDNSDGKGPCYGSPGDLVALPKSAPLPISHTWCEWADNDDPKSKVDLGGWAGLTGEGWYQWKPRDVPVDKQKYLGVAKVCFLEDRGAPKNINDFQREPVN